jgi:hypothetical protein
VIRTEAEIKEWICRRLGAPVVKVELTDDQLDDAVMLAKEYWQMWVGQCKAVQMRLTGTTEYSEADIGVDDLDYVADVVFAFQTSNLTDFFAWADVEINPFQYVFSGEGGYGMLVQYMQYREMGKRIVSADRDWDWDRAKRKLIIVPKETSTPEVEIFYISRNIDLSYLDTYEWRMFREYALSQAMKTLAHIRMKFADKPSAMGSFTMDGDSLYANAEGMEQQIEEKVRNLQHPTGFWAE